MLIGSYSYKSIDSILRSGLDRQATHSQQELELNVDHDWLKDGLNVIIHGHTGVGKTWIACALAHKVCREGKGSQPSICAYPGCSRNCIWHTVTGASTS